MFLTVERLDAEWVENLNKSAMKEKIINVYQKFNCVFLELLAIILPLLKRSALVIFFLLLHF